MKQEVTNRIKNIENSRKFSKIFENSRLHCVKTALAFCMMALLPLVARAQTDAQFSQYYEVPGYYNPAAVGLTDSLRFRADGRLQWIGIDNAPQSLLASADMPFKLGKNRIGVGVVAAGDKAGLFGSLNARAQAALKLKKFGGELAIGLSVGMYDQKFEGTDIFIPDDDDYHDSNDDAIPKKDIHGTGLDLGFGLWYRRPTWWAGLSCTHLNNPTVTMKNESTTTTAEAYTYEFTAQRTLYLMAGCNIPLKNTLFQLMPSVMLKSDLTFTTGEVTLRAKYNNFMICGLGYRWREAFTALVGVEMKDFYVGYSFDYSTTAIGRASAGSHEVVLGYIMKLDLGDKSKQRHKSIRIM